jgi:hypothetical protein
MPPIFTFPDGSFLEFDQGRFDDWCVYLTRPNQNRYAPRDRRYFQSLKDYAEKYTPQVIYADFVEIFNQTGKAIENRKMRDLITNLCEKYNENALEMKILFATLYMAMVAEENKANSILGKKVKRLGVYQILIENQSVEYAANYSTGHKWREIDEECKKRGF